MRIVVLLPVMFILTGNAIAQNGLSAKNKLTTSVYRNEMINETLNNIRINRFFNGMFYERHLKNNVSSILGIEYGENIIKDECKNCPDALYGEGKFKETSIYFGAKYKVNNRASVINLFVQADLYFSKSSYYGAFSGGFTGQGQNIDNRFNKSGLIGRIGLDISPVQRVTITPLTSFKYIRLKESRPPQNSTNLGWIPLELRIGVSF